MSDPLAHLESKYEVLGKIKEGGMGAIYKVRHRLLDETRIVKVMRQQFVDDPSFADRFNREARAAIRLRHPNIAQLFDFAVDEAGNASMVIEYVEGLDLKELLRRVGPPPIGITLEIAVQALGAVGFLHRRGMVHRDISPDNLMLSRDEDGQPVVKLIDLGIVKVLDADGSMTTTGIFLGKVRYASPEQFRSTEGGTIDQRSDLYSVGVVLYELLTGTFPITGDTSSAIMAGHLYRPPVGFETSDPAGRVSSPLRQIVLRLLEKDPSQRFQSADELTTALRRLQADSPWTADDLDRCCPSLAATPPAGRGGTDSAQGRVDRDFGGRATPGSGPAAPSAVSATAPTLHIPAEVAGDERAADLLAVFDRHIERGEAAEAAAVLETARAEHLDVPQLRHMEARLARVQPAPPPLPAAARRRSRRAPAALAVAVLVAAVAGGGYLVVRGRSRTPAAGQTLLESTGTLDPGGRDGMLVVHALPWAEVLEIRAVGGSAVALPRDAVTPLALALPAGDYTVVVRHPRGAGERTASAEVVAGRTATLTIEVVAQDPDSFLAKMGW